MKQPIQNLILNGTLLLFIITFSNCTLTHMYDARTMEKGTKNKGVFSSSFALAGKVFGLQHTVGYNVRFGRRKR